MPHALGAALVGIDGVPVEVEVSISSLLPRVDIVGLPEASVRESTARVRAVIQFIEQEFIEENDLIEGRLPRPARSHPVPDPHLPVR